MGITPDPEIVTYMAAMNKTGKYNFITEVFIRLLGLTNCADTIVVSDGYGPLDNMPPLVHRALLHGYKQRGWYGQLRQDGTCHHFSAYGTYLYE